jgi:hypothetical protein
VPLIEKVRIRASLQRCRKCSKFSQAWTKTFFPVIYNPLLQSISFEGEKMKHASRRAPRIGPLLLVLVALFFALPRLTAEPVALKRIVELALAHSTAAAAARADEQRVFAIR